MTFPVVYQADIRTTNVLAQSLAEWLVVRVWRLPGVALTDFLCMGRAVHLMAHTVDCNRSHAAGVFLHGAKKAPTTELPSIPSIEQFRVWYHSECPLMIAAKVLTPALLRLWLQKSEVDSRHLEENFPILEQLNFLQYTRTVTQQACNKYHRRWFPLDLEIYESHTARTLIISNMIFFVAAIFLSSFKRLASVSPGFVFCSWRVLIHRVWSVFLYLQFLVFFSIRSANYVNFSCENACGETSACWTRRRQRHIDQRCNCSSASVWWQVPKASL